MTQQNKQLPKLLAVLFASLCNTYTWAQPTYQQRIEDSVIGWEKMYNFKGKQYQPLIVDGQRFTPYQQSLRDSFITWVQRTYTPVGSQGTVWERNYTTRQKNGPVPQGIGADLAVWSVAFDRTGKKLERISETWVPVYIYSNVLMGRNDLSILCSTKQYFFTMPRQNYNSSFTDPSFINLVKDYGLHADDRFKKFMVYFDGALVNVVLTPGNQLPIIQLTKGEVLQALGDAIPIIVAREKADRSTNPAEQPRVEAEFKPRWLQTIARLKEKYKTRFSEPAYLVSRNGPSTADLYSIDEDIFVEGKPQYGPGFAVYRFDSLAIAQSKQDKPLWITISWQPQKPGALLKQGRLHEAMLHNFNFEYVYDYFFNPEKVKGQPYAPLNTVATKSGTGNKAGIKKDSNETLPEGIFFMDNFSTNPDGSKPAGWFSSSNGRQPAMVVSPKGMSGKWVQLGHMNAFSPTTALTKPLPENFTLEFDVATDAFSVRTGGAVMVSLSTYQLLPDGQMKPNDKGSTIELSITAGNDADMNNNNYSGGAKTSINSTVTGFSGNFNYRYALREFTSKKTNIHAALKIQNGELTLLVNNKQVAVSKDFKQDYDNNAVCKGLPPGSLFRNISFTNTTQNWSPDGKSNPVNVYISNFKITKE